MASMAAPAIAVPSLARVTRPLTAPEFGVTVNTALVAPANPVAVATSVYPVPALLIARSAKLAMPAAAFLVRVPVNALAPGFAPIDSVIAAADDVTVLPDASRTATVGGPGIGPPATALPG